jgi:cytochrome c-type biogenesis protein CcmH/NrfG
VDEPTLAEEVRLLRRDVHALLEAQRQYVTKEIMDLKLEALSKDQAEDRARLDAMSRWLWSGVVAPVIVGIILYVLLGKGPS